MKRLTPDQREVLRWRELRDTNPEGTVLHDEFNSYMNDALERIPHQPEPDREQYRVGEQPAETITPTEPSTIHPRHPAP